MSPDDESDGGPPRDELDRQLDRLDHDEYRSGAEARARPRRTRRRPPAPGRARGGAEADLQQADEAQSAIIGFALFGLLAIVVGVVIAVAAWPGTGEEYDYATGRSATVDTGSARGAIIGLIVAGVGQLLMLVAIIGYGVMLGVRAAKGPR